MNETEDKALMASADVRYIRRIAFVFVLLLNCCFLCLIANGVDDGPWWLFLLFELSIGSLMAFGHEFRQLFIALTAFLLLSVCYFVANLTKTTGLSWAALASQLAVVVLICIARRGIAIVFVLKSLLSLTVGGCLWTLLEKPLLFRLLERLR